MNGHVDQGSHLYISHKLVLHGKYADQCDNRVRSLHKPWFNNISTYVFQQCLIDWYLLRSSLQIKRCPESLPKVNLDKSAKVQKPIPARSRKSVLFPNINGPFSAVLWQTHVHNWSPSIQTSFVKMPLHCSNGDSVSRCYKMVSTSCGTIMFILQSGFGPKK